MSLKYSAEKLQGVPETLLVPLYARAVETQRENGIIHDPAAVEMVSRIDYDFGKFDTALASILGIAVRTEILDELTTAYLEKHPKAVIVNLGAGLDARFERLDNGHLRWIDLDLPEALELRRHFFQDDARRRMIASSALDFGWMDALSPQDDLFFIAEGLLMYFDEADVKRLLIELAGRFPRAEMLVEVIGVTQAKRTDRSDAISKTSASFKWGIRRAQEMATWDARIQYVTDISLYDRYPERWLELPISWPAPLADLRSTIDRIVHLRFTSAPLS